MTSWLEEINDGDDDDDNDDCEDDGRIGCGWLSNEIYKEKGRYIKIIDLNLSSLVSQL